MNEPADPQPRRPGSTAYRALLIAAVVIIVFKGAIVYRSIFVNDHHRDYYRWHRIARQGLEGGALAHPAGRGAIGVSDNVGENTFYKLPPAFAFYAMPLGALPYNVYVGVYYGLSVAAGAASLLLAMKCLHGVRAPTNPWLMILPLLLVAPYAWDDLHCGSNNLIVLVFLMAAAYWATRDRPSLGGLSLGMAVTLKTFPMAAVGALVLMRRWRLVAWALVGVVLWTLIVPGFFRGFDRTIAENRAWVDRVIAPYFEGAARVQWKSKGVSVSNQSLWGMVNRFTRPVNTLGKYAEGGVLRVNFIELTAKQAAILFAGLLAAASAAMAWAAWAGRYPPDRRRRVVALDCAIAMTFILLASPIAWTYFYTLLLLPAALAAHIAFAQRGRWPSKLSIAALAASVPICILALTKAARACGGLTWLALLWFAVLLILRRHAATALPPEPAQDSL